MNYKKLHEDTINRLQQMVSCGKITVEVARGICADFIPESEDEKIRNEIIDYLERFIPHHEYDLVAKSRIWIDWLKKQGKNNMGISEATKQELENNLNNALKKETPESWDKFLDEQGEPKPAEVRTTGYWNVQDMEQKPEINDDVLSRFAFYQYDDDAIYLSSLFVRESDRGRGYGSKVLKAAEEVAKIFGISKIRLKVERNTWMEEWYKKNGYEYISFEDKYDWFEKRCEQKFVDKCKDCNNVKGCITCTDGDQYAHITEQKPTDKIEPKFKVGDSIKTANEEPLTITEITDIGYWSEDLFICNFDDADKWELVEKKIETIEIPFGAKDSELMGATYYIPEGFHAEIDGNKVIIKQGEQQPAWSRDDEQNLNVCLCYIDDEYLRRWLKDIIHVKYDKLAWSESHLGDGDAIADEYIDLGLPSGTLWKSVNEEGYYTYNEAVEKFQYRLPQKYQCEELAEKCKWEWKDNGYKVTGPNGNTIFLPAAGYYDGTDVYGEGMYGYYWSSMYVNEGCAWSMGFGDDFLYVSKYNRNYGRSVRLVK